MCRWASASSRSIGSDFETTADMPSDLSRAGPPLRSSPWRENRMMGMTLQGTPSISSTLVIETARPRIVLGLQASVRGRPTSQSGQEQLDCPVPCRPAFSFPPFNRGYVQCVPAASVFAVLPSSTREQIGLRFRHPRGVACRESGTIRV
jgi:hypothetical protein